MRRAEAEGERRIIGREREEEGFDGVDEVVERPTEGVAVLVDVGLELGVPRGLLGFRWLPGAPVGFVEDFSRETKSSVCLRT